VATENLQNHFILICSFQFIILAKFSHFLKRLPCTAKPESRCGDCIWSSWVEIRTSTTFCPVNVVGARLQCLFRQFNENDPEKRLAKFGSISDMNFFQKITILLHSCLHTGTYHKNLEFWIYFLIWWIWAILSMKNPLSVYVETVFSFGQIPNTMATKKQIQCKV
jgi:hypothetical protein